MCDVCVGQTKRRPIPLNGGAFAELYLVLKFCMMFVLYYAPAVPIANRMYLLNIYL